jgi:hypothetical protein
MADATLWVGHHATRPIIVPTSIPGSFFIALSPDVLTHSPYRVANASDMKESPIVREKYYGSSVRTRKSRLGC